MGQKLQGRTARIAPDGMKILRGKLFGRDDRPERVSKNGKRCPIKPGLIVACKPGEWVRIGENLYVGVGTIRLGENEPSDRLVTLGFRCPPGIAVCAIEVYTDLRGPLQVA